MKSHYKINYEIQRARVGDADRKLAKRVRRRRKSPAPRLAVVHDFKREPEVAKAFDTTYINSVKGYLAEQDKKLKALAGDEASYNKPLKKDKEYGWLEMPKDFDMEEDSKPQMAYT